MKKFILSAVAALCASAAMAAPVVTSGTLTRGQFEYVPTVTSNISAPVLSGFQNVYAGAMNFTFDAVSQPPSFLAFCIDLTSYAGAQGVGIVYDKVDEIRGMDIVFVTTAKTDAEAKSLLKKFDIPFVA